MRSYPFRNFTEIYVKVFTNANFINLLTSEDTLTRPENVLLPLQDEYTCCHLHNKYILFFSHEERERT